MYPVPTGIRRWQVGMRYVSYVAAPFLRQQVRAEGLRRPINVRLRDAWAYVNKPAESAVRGDYRRCKYPTRHTLTYIPAALLRTKLII